MEKNTAKPRIDKVDIVDLLGKADLRVENIVNDASHNALYFSQAAEYYLSKLRAKNAAERELEMAEADIEQQLRKDARDAGDRITDSAVKASIAANAGIRKLREKLDTAEEDENYGKLIIEMFRMRRDCIEVIKDLVRSDASMQRAAESAAAGFESLRSATRKRYPGSI